MPNYALRITKDYFRKIIDCTMYIVHSVPAPDREADCAAYWLRFRLHNSRLEKCGEVLTNELH